MCARVLVFVCVCLRACIGQNIPQIPESNFIFEEDILEIYTEKKNETQTLNIRIHEQFYSFKDVNIYNRKNTCPWPARGLCK